MSTVALIPLRGGSKGIPGKNIKLIAGKPLCAWVLEAAVHSKRVESCYVSTECKQIKQVVERLGLGIQVIDRPQALATDEASTEAVILHFAEQVPFSQLVTIQATSPMLRASDLDAALERFEAEGYDSLLSVVRERSFFWNDDGTPINYDPRCRPRRQEFQGTLKENGAFYCTTRDTLEREQCRLGGRIGFYEMAEETLREIDEVEDWAVIEKLLYQRNIS